MKTIARNVAALIAVGLVLSVAACGGTPPKPADADDAAVSADDEEKPKKELKGMKGDKMEKADAEE